MKEYIDKEKALQILEDSGDAYGTFSVERSIYLTARQKVKNIPAADVAEVRHGEWIPVCDTVQDILKEFEPYEMLRGYKCSLCGRFEEKEELYCHCGARMDKEDEYEIG